jgi:hypothetical protein
MTQLARGEPLSPAYLARNALTMFSFGLCNATRTIDHLVAHHTHPYLTDDEFVGMADYIMESIHDLLVGDSESISDSDSSGGSHHPSHECFMAEVKRKNTLDGHIKSVHGGNVTPPAHLDDEDEGEEGARVLPHPRMDQLRARQQELKDA